MFEREMIPRPKRRSTDEHQQATNAHLWRDMAPEQTADSGMLPGPVAAHSIGSIAIESPQPSVGPAGGTVPTDISDRIVAKQGGGAALDAATRTRMETDLGHHFADVRIHADDESDALNRSFGANAFTLGSDIFLGRDATSAGSYGGDQILAHELTHVVQQRGAAPGGPLTVGAVDDPQEHEAAAAAEAIGYGSPARQPMAVQAGRASIAPMRIQRDKGSAGKDDMADMKRQMTEMRADVDALKQQQAIGKNKQAATALDLRWRGIFGERMASYKQAIWRITGGIDAAEKGFTDAQVAQSQTDQLATQLIGLGAAVLFAGGFEWVAGMGLKGLGSAATKIGSRVKDVDAAVAEIGEGASIVSLPGGPGRNIFSRVGDRLRDPSSIIETIENPANAAFGGYMTNIRGAQESQRSTAQIGASVSSAETVTGSPNIYPQGSVFNRPAVPNLMPTNPYPEGSIFNMPDANGGGNFCPVPGAYPDGSVFGLPLPAPAADTGTSTAAAAPSGEQASGRGGGAIAFLAAKSEALEKHGQDIEKAFIDRSKQLETLDDAKWAGFDVSKQEKVYQSLLDELNASASGIEKMQTQEIVAEVIEKYMWADWILHSADRESGGRLWNFGTDIDLRLIKLGIEKDVNRTQGGEYFGLSEHWWQHSTDDWGYRISQWARDYKGSIVK